MMDKSGFPWFDRLSLPGISSLFAAMSASIASFLRAAPSKSGLFHNLERSGVLAASGISIGMAVLGLWIAIWSTQEKVRLSHGVDQIIRVVNLSRELAQSYPYLGNTGYEDLLAALSRVQMLQEARETDGVFALKNPWDGLLFAVTTPNRMMRVETIVPPRTCRRIVDIFAENPGALGVLRIEVKGWEQPWKTVYAANENLAFDDDLISSVCQSAARAQVSLRMKLR